ncbi:terminase large subunit [Shewanella sp. SE1]|nr:terminase large subunit [Shewanella sp. SE1]
MTNDKLKRLSKYDHLTNNPDFTDRIAGNKLDSEYCQDWRAADQYAYDILSNRIQANKWTRLACERYFNYRENPDYYLDKKSINLIILIANGLNHVKGPLGGKPIRLMHWLIFIIANVYGFRHRDTKNLVFNKAFIFVARGNAKSTLLSVLSIYSLMFNRNESPLTVSAARTRDQARIIFEDARKMILNANEYIRDKFEVQQHQIICLANNGVFKPVSSDSQSMDGMRTTQVLIDELHSHRSTNTKDTLETGLSSSIDSVMFMISTAGENLPSNPAKLEQQIGRDIVSGNINQPNYFYLEYSLDDHDDWQNQDNWIKANPSLGHSVYLDNLIQDAQLAKSVPSKRTSFLTKHCNVFYRGSEDSFIDQTEYSNAVAPFRWESFGKQSGYRCYIGVDLAYEDDLCSVAYIFEHTQSGKRYATTRSFITSGMLQKTSEHMAKIYSTLKDDSHLIVYQGYKQDHAFIMRDVLDQISKYDLDVSMIGYDAASGGTQFAQNLNNEDPTFIPDDNLISVRQGYGLSDAALELRSDIASQNFNLDDQDTTMKYCLFNVCVTQGTNNTIKLDRPKGTNKTVKIDAAIALTIAYRTIIFERDYKHKQTSIYEKKDIFFL